MKAIALIGANFVRGQWIVLTIMLAYILGFAGVVSIHEQRSELLYFLRMEALYVLGFGMLVAIPAIQSERKSRRILAVLSKGIHRWQYLGGLLCGCVMIAGLLCLLVGAATVLLARQISMPSTGIASLMLVLFLACSAAAAVALFCSVFLHPLLALGAASLILLTPFLLQAKGWYPPSILFPVSAVIGIVQEFTFQKPGSGLWRIGAAAVVQTIVFWIAASVVFSRRDVTVATE